MPDLQNKLAWSVTRARALSECPRSYYYSYYLSWGGWEPSAPEQSRKAYVLHKMTNLDLLAGEVVHTVIEAILNALPAAHPMSVDEARDKALALLNQAWHQSESRQWQHRPSKFVNLFEHYYGIHVPPERPPEIRGKVLTCVDNFCRGEPLEFIRTVDPKDWLPIEQFQSFALEGTPVTLKIDFALHHRGEFYLYDWKSGKEGDDPVTQLACYALYATRTWAAQPANTWLVPVYLLTKTAKHLRLTEDDLQRAQADIQRGYAQMRAMLADPDRNLADIGNFPLTAETWRCARCSFKELCEQELAQRPQGTPF